MVYLKVIAIFFILLFGGESTVGGLTTDLISIQIQHEPLCYNFVEAEKIREPPVHGDMSVLLIQYEYRVEWTDGVIVEPVN